MHGCCTFDQHSLVYSALQPSGSYTLFSSQNYRGSHMSKIISIFRNQVEYCLRPCRDKQAGQLALHCTHHVFNNGQFLDNQLIHYRIEILGALQDAFHVDLDAIKISHLATNRDGSSARYFRFSVRPTSPTGSSLPLSRWKENCWVRYDFHLLFLSLQPSRYPTLPFR